MASPPVIRHEHRRVPPTAVSKRHEAIAALDAVLATVEQHRPVLSPWECFHFRRALNALLAGNYKRVWIDAENALIPFAERTARAKATMQAAGPLDPCTVRILRRELTVARTEPFH